MHKLLTVMVSFNRPHLLKETIASYLETVSCPFDLVVVDNASDAPTREWLITAAQQIPMTLLLLPENRYPGYATNRAWRLVDDHTILHRSDSDVRYLPGWSDQVTGKLSSMMRSGRKIGQVGLMTDQQEGTDMPAVGGNMAIRREIYDAGVRYTDLSWREVPWEDGMMTKSVVDAGWGWSRVDRKALVHLGDPPDFTDPYYVETYSIRGILPEGVDR